MMKSFEIITVDCTIIVSTTKLLIRKNGIYSNVHSVYEIFEIEALC